MPISPKIVILAAAAALAGCGTTNVPQAVTPLAPMAAEAERPASVRVAEFAVEVPRSLQVSEANRYYPSSDIVWRGDPFGDRYAQIEAIFGDAIRAARPRVAGETPVDLKIVVHRFHALTEKARYSVGGVHAITFDMAVLDPKTGRQLGPTRRVVADLRAYGGEDAIAADQRGETQRVRIVRHLARVIASELAAPGSAGTPRLGLMQSINEL